MMAAFIYFIIQDAKGQKSRVEVPFPSATALADLEDLVPAIAALINPLVTGGLVGAGFAVEIDLSGTWGPVAALDSDVQEKAEFSFRTAGGFNKRVNLPTFDEQFFNPQSVEVDTADAAVAAFVTAMEDGVTVNSTLCQPCDRRGDDVVSLIAATENWGKRRA